LTELALASEISQEQKGLEADRNDAAWAREKLINQEVSKEDVPQPE
jgi:hypothetical protein